MTEATARNAVEAWGRPGHELKDLLAPLPVDTFLREHWQHETVHIRGMPDKFAGLFHADAFWRILDAPDAQPMPPTFQINAMLPGGDGVTHVRAIAPHRARALMVEGVTLCVNDISAADARLAAFVRAIKAQLGHPGWARFNCYHSPDGSGAALHFDARVSMTLQIAGRKQWQVARHPAVPAPRSNALLGADGEPRWAYPWVGDQPWEQLATPDPDDLLDVVLEPGDVLCVPAGTWHSAKAIGGSLALNLAVEPLRFAAFLDRLLEPVFLPDPDWRHGTPCATGAAEGTLPDEVADYFRDRLDQLRTLLDVLREDDLHLARTWQRLVVAGAAPWGLPLPAPDEDTALARDEPLAHAGGYPVGYTLHAPTETLYLYHGPTELAVRGAAAVAFFRALAATPRFRAEDATRWSATGETLDWQSVEPMLLRLLRAGVLCRERAG